MNNKIWFCSRIRVYNLTIDYFDFLDYELMMNQLQMHKFVILKIEKEIVLDNYKNINELLILEWNGNQRFSTVKTKNSNSLHNYVNLELTLRNHTLYRFLDNCLNSIFLDKNSIFFEKYKNYLYSTINQPQWNWFSCHFLLSNFLFAKKRFLLSFLLKTFFFVPINTYSNNLFLIKSWIFSYKS